jgi:tubulin polyglutamylase TTLL6/13
MLSAIKRSKRTFIVKPDRGSQGRGIFLIQDPEDICDYTEQAVAQQYIAPFLIDGYKFDLRIYVLVTSVDPLRLYVHREGMARFCTEKYEKPRPGNLGQYWAHLTNYSLNKKNEHFETANTDDGNTGSKRSLTSVYREIDRLGHSVIDLQRKIDDIIRLTIGAIQPFLASNYHTAIRYGDRKSRCFEILGFDILIDRQLHPWILEVNCMPSLACDSPFDTTLKYSVIKGALKIIDINPGFRRDSVAFQKATNQRRIRGVSKKFAEKSLFDPETETTIARSTNWREIWPRGCDQVCTLLMQSALENAKEVPCGHAAETQAYRVRKEAALSQIRKKREKEAERKRKQEEGGRPPFQNDCSSNLMPPLKSYRAVVLHSPTRKRTLKRLPVAEVDIIDEVFCKSFAALPSVQITDSEEEIRLEEIKRHYVGGDVHDLEKKVREMLMIVAWNEQREERQIPSSAGSGVRVKCPAAKTLFRPVINCRTFAVND